MVEPILVPGSLTPRLRRTLDHLAGTLQAQTSWLGQEPVALLERCWLRLDVVGIGALPQRLPPDPSEAAPELVRYRQLRADGWPDPEAERQCWQEFGEQACRQALQRYWQAQDSLHHGWTLECYLQLVRRYRAQFSSAEPRRLPLLILARTGSPEPHQLHWLPPAERTMRHTCA